MKVYMIYTLEDDKYTTTVYTPRAGNQAVVNCLVILGYNPLLYRWYRIF
jgi:hypothetical protein